MKNNICAAAQTHVGKVRKNNEDNYYLAGSIRKDVTKQTAQVCGNFSQRRFLAAVADGMGGEALGELASLIAVKAMKPCSISNVREQAQKSIDRANRKICAKIKKNGARIGSTLAALYIDDGKAYSCNLGDSRCYFFRKGKLRQLSTDHNHAGQMLRAGVLTPDQASRHPGRHQLTQHLGIFPDEMILQPAFSEAILLQKGDRFLLCSDGLTDMLRDEEIAGILAEDISPDEQAEKFINCALERGARDNVTVLIVQVKDLWPKKTDPELEEARRRVREEQQKRREEREAFLQPWSGIDPDSVEKVAEWEKALEADCMLKSYYLVNGVGAEGLDGVHDFTGADWFWLESESDLKKAIEIYAEIDDYRKACEVHKVPKKRTENHVLNKLMSNYYDQRFWILPDTDVQIAVLGSEKETCLELCRRHLLHLVCSEKDNRYYDFVSGKTYEVYVSGMFPGSADDAATYGVLSLRTVERENK